MKTFKMSLLALFAVVTAMIGLSGPALAADSWGGSGTPFSISTYNYTQTGFLPSAPSSVPAGSTITGVSYNFDWTSRSYVGGAMTIALCSSSTNCTAASRFSNSTSFFDGLPANTSLYFRASFSSGFKSGTISGGPLNVTTSVSVSYN